MQFKSFSRNGQLLPFSQAVVPLTNINFQYGFGVYETLKIRNNILYFAKEHISRLLKSAEIISLDHPFESEEIAAHIASLIADNSLESANIKMLLIGGKTPDDCLLYILPLAPLYPDRKLYSQGASVGTVNYERFLPGAKTLNMLPSFLFYTRAREKGHYDCLYLDKNDNILEGSRTNFFALKDDTLITPPKELVLDGVTRATVIHTALAHGFKLKEEPIPLSYLHEFDASFLTSTSSKIIPLKNINEFRFASIHPRLKELMQHYDTFLDNSSGIFKNT